MRLDCIIGNHSPLPKAVRNQGFTFSRCRRCGDDMIRSGRAWRRVPKGFRVVWRAQPAPTHAAAPRDLTVPAQKRARFNPAAGLIDLIRAALKVLLWALVDQWRGLGQWVLALPNRSARILRLPAPTTDPYLKRRVGALDTVG
jgi:hypothetical protein